jgi:Tol biopolymer transport system component
MMFRGLCSLLQGAALGVASLTFTAHAQAGTGDVPAAAAPSVVAPGVISGPANDADFALTPDGNTAVFARESAILISHQVRGAWSTPVIAPFSGVWRDLQPTLSPDGSFLVFVSNRPLKPGEGKRPSSLWRVSRAGAGWGEPAHLLDEVHRADGIYAPSIAGDGSLYFIARDSATAPFRIWRSQLRRGQYEPAVAISFGDATTQDVDPAVAPDESFLVFGSMHPGTDKHERLFISFRQGDRWGTPVDLGDAVNGAKDSSDTNEPRLGPDHRTVYFSSDRTVALHFPRTRAQAEADLARVQAWDNGNINIWRASLAPWLDGPHAN